MNTWYTTVGAWGDTFCAYGNICKLLKDRGEEKANVVYFGLDQNICEFLKAQPNIDKVSWLKIDSPQVIGKYITMANEDVPQWLEVTGLKEQLPNLVISHITRKEQQETTQCHRDFDPRLPDLLGNWDEFCKDKHPYILFQPFSTQSCSYLDHWPHWMDALRYVLDNTDNSVIVAGEVSEQFNELSFDFALLENPKVSCIVGQTRSMIDLLHIANGASKIITTCNALSCWSVLKKVPALVVCNKVIKSHTPYYYNWIKTTPNVVLDHDATLEDFKTALNSSTI